MASCFINGLIADGLTVEARQWEDAPDNFTVLLHFADGWNSDRDQVHLSLTREQFEHIVQVLEGAADAARTADLDRATTATVEAIDAVVEAVPS